MARKAVGAELAMARAFLTEYPVEAARLMEGEAEDACVETLAVESASVVAGVLRALSPERASRVVVGLPAELTAAILRDEEPSRASRWLARMSPDERDRCLAEVDGAVADDLRELIAYPPDTAGSLMDPRIKAFTTGTTVGTVIRSLRRFRRDSAREVWLVDADGRFAGSVALQEIILAGPTSKLADLERSGTGSVSAMAGREELCRTFEEHRLETLPVVDFDSRLLGVLHASEIVHAAQEESLAGAVTMVGAGEEERALSSPAFAVRKRLPWLQVNLVTAFLAAAVVGMFEGLIAATPALAILLPVVAGQSGNTGAQALAVTVRALALREVRTRQWRRVVTKEVLAGLGNGIAVALTTSAVVYAWSRSVGLALVILLSMILSMTLAGLSGAAIPLALTAMRQDPAQSSSIILTTVTDIIGFGSFLGIATLLYNMI